MGTLLVPTTSVLSSVGNWSAAGTWGTYPSTSNVGKTTQTSTSYASCTVDNKNNATVSAGFAFNAPFQNLPADALVTSVVIHVGVWRANVSQTPMTLSYIKGVIGSAPASVLTSSSGTNSSYTDITYTVPWDWISTGTNYFTVAFSRSGGNNLECRLAWVYLEITYTASGATMAGNLPVTGINMGTTPITELRLGTIKVWPT